MRLIILSVLMATGIACRAYTGFYSERPAQRWQESLVTGNGVMGAMLLRALIDASNELKAGKTTTIKM